VNDNWKVNYSCPKWADSDEGLSEQEARQRYEQYCKSPPIRGGVRAKVVVLYDSKGTYVQGFAAGGQYGKVV
jgi:hypothetical protein